MVFRARGIRLLACCFLGIELHVAKCMSFLGSILLKHIKLIYNTYINRTLVYRSVVFERVREIHNYTKLSPSSWHMQIVFKFLVSTIISASQYVPVLIKYGAQMFCCLHLTEYLFCLLLFLGRTGL